LEINGLYFLGFPWLRKRKSGIVFGIEEDAKFISEKIMELNDEYTNRQQRTVVKNN
jgi:hypothetical protein